MPSVGTPHSVFARRSETDVRRKDEKQAKELKNSRTDRPTKKKKVNSLNSLLKNKFLDVLRLL